MKIVRCTASALVFLVHGCDLLAQPVMPRAPVPIFSLTGKSRLTTESESPRGANSGMPEKYARWEFEPTLSIYQVPIGARVLLSTENDPNKSAMNSIELLFDVQAFQKMLRDRVIAQAKATQESIKDQAAAIQSKLSSPEMEADISRYKELSTQDSVAKLEGQAKEELAKLREQVDEANKLKAQAERYSKMNAAQEAKEKENQIRSLTNEISDPNKLVDKLKDMDLFSGAEKFMFGFKDLGIGVNYPRYNPMVLEGLSLNGLSMEYTLGPLTIAGAGGKLGAPIAEDRVYSQTFKRTAYAGKLGIGATAGSHLHFIGFYASDDPTTATADSAYSPQRNHVLALDGRLELFNKSITLSGLAASSMLTRDVTAPTVDTFKTPSPLATSIANHLTPNVSSSVDYAWKAGLDLNLFKGATHAKCSAQMIGPGYMSLGVPYLQTDIIGQDAEIEQELFGGAVSLTGFYDRNQDNILPWKRTLVNNEWLPARTTQTSYGGSFGLQPDGLPYIRVEYAPFVQQTAIDSVDSTATNSTSLISGTAGYSYQIGKLQLATTVMGVVQQGKSHGGVYDFANDFVAFNQSVTFTGLTLALTGSYTSTIVRDVTTTIIGGSGSGTFVILKDWKGTLGLNYSDRGDGGYKFGYSARTNVKLFGHNELELRADKNVYEPGVTSGLGYDQLRLRMIVTTQW